MSVVISLNCANCGASLKSTQETRVLTCSYCASSLQVLYSEGAFSTEIFEEMGHLKRGLSEAALELRLARLDKELANARSTAALLEQQFKATDFSISLYLSDILAYICIGAGILVILVGAANSSSDRSQDASFLVFGALVSFTGIVVGILGAFGKSQERRQKKETEQAFRRRVLDAKRVVARIENEMNETKAHIFATPDAQKNQRTRKET